MRNWLFTDQPSVRQTLTVELKRQLQVAILLKMFFFKKLVKKKTKNSYIFELSFMLNYKSYNLDTKPRKRENFERRLCFRIQK